MLRINDKNCDLITLLCLTMLEEIRVNLMCDLNIIYENGIYSKNTQEEGERNDFQAIHYSYYN